MAELRFILFLCYIHLKIQNKNVRIVCTILVLMSLGLMIIAAMSILGEAFFKYALNYNITGSNTITSSDAMITILTVMMGTVFIYIFNDRK
jgi:hypothetical protein